MKLIDRLNSIDRDTKIRRLSIGGVVVSATVLSYSTLHHRALVIGIPEWSAWFYPALYDAFILAASRMWQNPDLSSSTRSMARTATLGTIGAALLAFIAEFYPHGPVAMLFSLIIPAVLATSLVLLSRSAADRKTAAEKAQEEPKEVDAPETPTPAYEPVSVTMEASTDASVGSEPTVVTFSEMPMIDLEPGEKRAWVHYQLDIGTKLTGAMIDKRFGGRNGGRLLKSVLAEREKVTS